VYMVWNVPSCGWGFLFLSSRRLSTSFAPVLTGIKYSIRFANQLDVSSYHYFSSSTFLMLFGVVPHAHTEFEVFFSDKCFPFYSARRPKPRARGRFHAREDRRITDCSSSRPAPGTGNKPATGPDIMSLEEDTSRLLVVPGHKTCC